MQDAKRSVVISGEEWRQHRDQASAMNTKIEEIDSTIRSYVEYLSNLTVLPRIATSIESLEKGLLTQNETILRQNDKLLIPASHANKIFTMVTLFAVALLGAVLLLVLIRETDKEIRFGGVNGLHITGNTSGDKE